MWFNYFLSFLYKMKKYQIYLGGEFISTENELMVQNPHTQEDFATTYLAGEAEFEKATQLAQNSQELMEYLDLAEAQSQLKSKIKQLCKFDLLILDELGYLPWSRKSVFNFKVGSELASK